MKKKQMSSFLLYLAILPCSSAILWSLAFSFSPTSMLCSARSSSSRLSWSKNNIRNLGNKESFLVILTINAPVVYMARDVIILLQGIFACIQIIRSRYFLYIRWWFSNLFDALLLEKKIQSFCLLLIVTLFRDGLFILKRHTGSRLWSCEVKQKTTCEK